MKWNNEIRDIDTLYSTIYLVFSMKFGVKKLDYGMILGNEFNIS